MPLLWYPPNAYAGMTGLPAEIDRSSFEERINAWYPSSDAKPWFVTTEYGMVTSRARQKQNLQARLAFKRSGKGKPAFSLA